MARVKSAVTKRKRHKKILKQAKGYFGHKHVGFRTAKEQIRKSNEYAFRDRKQVKREMRKLWIKRINAATRFYEMSYSQFINGLKKAQIEMNRKMLADIAFNDLEQFGHLVNESKVALGQPKVEIKPIIKEAPRVKVTKPKVQKEPKTTIKPVMEIKKEVEIVEKIMEEVLENTSKEIKTEEKTDSNKGLKPNPLVKQVQPKPNEFEEAKSVSKEKVVKEVKKEETTKPVAKEKVVKKEVTKPVSKEKAITKESKPSVKKETIKEVKPKVTKLVSKEKVVKEVKIEKKPNE